MSKTLIVDGNAVGYACHMGVRLTSGSLQTQAVFGFIRVMRDLRRTYPKHTILVLWDGRAQWRFDLHPIYKSNRDNDPKKVAMKEAYAEQRPYIARALKALGIRQVTALKHEADDMAGYFVAELTQKPENEVVLITGDEDWLQLVRPKVTWVDFRNEDKTTTMANLFDRTGYKTPYAFLEGKCLQGDSSDVIPGVGKIGEKGAPEFLAEFGSVREFWRRVDAGEFVPKKVGHKNLASPEGRKAFARNLKLMQLLKVEKPAKEDLVVVAGPCDEDALRTLCEELNFSSILSNLPNFISTFKAA